MQRNTSDSIEFNNVLKIGPFRAQQFVIKQQQQQQQSTELHLKQLTNEF